MPRKLQKPDHSRQSALYFIARLAAMAGALFFLEFSNSVSSGLRFWSWIAFIVLIIAITIINFEKPDRVLKLRIWWLGPAFCGVLGMLALGYSGWQIIEALASQHWMKTDGFVTSIRQDLHPTLTMAGGFYDARVWYRYEVAGASYTGERVSFSTSPSFSHRKIQTILDRYPVGKAVSVFVSPENPKLAVLEPGIPGGIGLLPGFGFLFVWYGFVLVIVKRRMTPKGAAQSA